MAVAKKDRDFGGGKKKLSLWQNLKQNVLSNPGAWCLAICYFFVYAIRQGVTSWAIFYMIEVKGARDAGEAAVGSLSIYCGLSSAASCLLELCRVSVQVGPCERARNRRAVRLAAGWETF